MKGDFGDKDNGYLIKKKVWNLENTTSEEWQGSYKRDGDCWSGVHAIHELSFA